MIILIGNVCGWMATNFLLVHILMLTTYGNTIFFKIFFWVNLPFPFFFFQIQLDPPTYLLAPSYELTHPSP
jgi:hypothetical protein